VYDVNVKYTPAPLTFHVKKFTTVPFVSLKVNLITWKNPNFCVKDKSVHVFFKRNKRQGDTGDVIGEILYEKCKAAR
jgi:hypothetical protein